MSRWTERQHALLKAMGVGAFWPDAPELAGVQPEGNAPAPASPPLPSKPPAPAVRAGVNAATQTTQAQPLPEAVMHAAARPPASDVAAMDWPALTETIRGCQACGLCTQRKQAVVGVGHTRARWMLVGEAPGEQEDLRGEPFVGRAGQLLDRILYACGLTREAAAPEQQVYIANVIKCRPPGNRNPTPEEIQRCEAYLVRQVQLVQPQIIVAMGRFAAQTLLRSAEPIGRMRGRMHQYEGIPLLVTYHPAYLLRNPADKALAWDDWCLAREWVDQRSVR